MLDKKPEHDHSTGAIRHGNCSKHDRPAHPTAERLKKRWKRAAFGWRVNLPRVLPPHRQYPGLRSATAPEIAPAHGHQPQSCYAGWPARLNPRETHEPERAVPSCAILHDLTYADEHEYETGGWICSDHIVVIPGSPLADGTAVNRCAITPSDQGLPMPKPRPTPCCNT